MHHETHFFRVFVFSCFVVLATTACLAIAAMGAGRAAPTVQDAGWPVNGGVDNIRYSPLTQINRDNVSTLQRGVDLRLARRLQGLRDAEQPDRRRRRALCDDADAQGDRGQRGERAGRSGSSIRAPARRRAARFRHRGVTVHKDRVFVDLSQLPLGAGQEDRPADRLVRHGRPHRPARRARPAGRAAQRQREHAWRRLRGPADHRAAAVPETLPGSPGHIRAFDVNTGKAAAGSSTRSRSRASSATTHGRRTRTCCRAARTRGRVSPWTPTLGMVFAATGSASFDLATPA